MTPAETLFHIETRLAVTTPMNIISELMPRTGAIRWAQRLSHWDEFRGQFSDQAIGIARIVSRRAMREHGLILTDDGRVTERRPMSYQAPTPSATFRLDISGQSVEVAYTADYYPGRDGFLFTAEKNPLSESGLWHTFVPQDAVEALGGPQAFAARCAEAKMAGQEKEFIEGFEGRFPEKKGKKKSLGEHTAAVVDQVEGLNQGQLF
jgi:hypothetical protein